VEGDRGPRGAKIPRCTSGPSGTEKEKVLVRGERETHNEGVPLQDWEGDIGGKGESLQLIGGRKEEGGGTQKMCWKDGERGRKRGGEPILKKTK